MKHLLRKMPLIDWVLWFGLGGYLAYTGIRIGSILLLGISGVLLTAGYAQLSAKSWAWTAGLCGYLATILLPLHLLATKGPSLGRLAGLAIFIWVLIDHVRSRNQTAAVDESTEPADVEEEKTPPVSIVLWLSEPRYLDESLLAAIAGRALGESFTGDDEHPNFVVGKGFNFILKHRGVWFLIHNWSRNYFDDPENAANDVHELRRHNAVRDHRAWLAVDFLRADGDIDPVDTLPVIGRLVAELAEDKPDVLALFYPRENWVYPWESEMAGRLRSGDPLSAFDSDAVPVVRVSGDSEKLINAVAEARRRWPEFAAAFHASAEKDRFMVKAPITEAGNTEYIWITVKAIANGQIHGLLANDPVALGKLRLGDFVSVPETDINDWLHPDPDNPETPIGLFTLPAMRAENS